MNPQSLSDYSPKQDVSGDFKKVLTDRYEGAKKITPEMLEALRSGNADAFKAVYHIAHRPLYAFVAKGFPKFDSEDIVQAVMIEIWEKRGRIDPSKNFGSFLFRIAANYACNIYRRSKVEQSYLSHAQNEFHYMSAPDDIMIEEQMELLMEIALMQMPGRRREIYELYRDEGMTYEQIAEKLKVSRETVKYNLGIAKKQLSELLLVFIALISISQ